MNLLLSTLGHWALTGSRLSTHVRHCQLTDSLARTNVVLFIHRTVRLLIHRVVDLNTQHSTLRTVL